MSGGASTYFEPTDVQSDLVFPQFGPEAWVLETLRRLARVVKLQENWDTYGSPPPQQRAVDATFRALDALRDLRMPSAFVVPISGGGLQLEWRSTGRELELEILPDGRMEYLLAERNQPPVEGTVSATSRQELRALADWLING